MLILNNLLAKSLSKIVKGFWGTLVHFFIMGYIYRTIINGLVPLLEKLGMLFFPADPETAGQLSMLIYLLLWPFTGILQVVGTFKAHKIYKGEQQNAHQTFGKARFSDSSEVEKAHLNGPGVVFGKQKRQLVTKPPHVEGHSLIVGGTGTGKSRGIVIPSLLLWEGAALVMDIKGELSRITSQRRKLFGPVYIFNPEGDGDCYDPIQFCKTVEQAQEIARTLVPLPVKGEPFWSQSAQAILSAFIFEGAAEGARLADIAEKLCTTPIYDLVEHCREHDLREVRLLASICYDLPEKVLGGVIGELKSKLITIATDPNIRKATSRSDWTPASLEEGATIFLKVSEHLLEQYRDLWTVIISQVLRHLSQREERKDPPILIALDELPRLSKINGFTNALATLRSRNVHIVGVIQSMAQLDKLYGRDDRKVIADNCRFKLVLSATDPETQKYFSDLAGQRTAMAKGVSSGSGWLPNVSRSEQGIPLIRPEEWAHLEQPILLAPKLQPVKLDLAFWDQEKELKQVVG